MKIFQKYKFWILAFLSFLFLRIPSLFEPYWYGDEGIYLTLGEGVRKGLTLYSQIHDNKPPLLYFLAALGQTVFGFRLILLICMIPTVYLFYKLSQQFLDETKSKITTIIFIIITSIPLLEGSIANAEIFMLLPTIGGVYLVYKSQKIADFFLSGLLLGLAFAIKVPVAVELVFLLFWIFITQIIKKDYKTIVLRFLALISGFIVPISMFAVLYFLKGAFKNFIYASLLQNFGYLSSWSTGTQTASMGQGGLFTRLIILVVFYLIIAFFFFKKRLDFQTVFLTLWFAATVFGSLLSARPYPHYLIQILPPLCLSLLYFYEKEKLHIHLLGLFCLFFLFFVIKKFNFYTYPVFSYYTNFYAYTFGLKSQEKYFSFFGSEVNNTYKISQYVSQNTTPNQKIFVWGDNAFIYALSDRLPVGRYTVSYHIADFNGYQEIISLLTAHFPPIIVYYSMPDRPFPQLDNFVNLFYYPDQVFGQTIIYRFRQ